MVLFILERPIHGTLRWSAPAACAHRTTCPNSLSTSGGAGTATRAACSGAWITRCGARPPTTRCACSGMMPRATLERPPGSRVAASSTTRRSPALDAARQRDYTWWASRCPTRRPVDRLLLGRVRAAPVAADLRGRPRRARRRSLQGGERPRRAAHRRRLHVPAGLLPPAHLRRRLAGGRLREAELGRCPDRAGTDARRRAVRSPPCRSATARCSWPCGACAWAASTSTCSTPTSKRTRPGIGSSRRASTAATAKRASSRKSSSASAASARSARLAVTRPSCISTKAMRIRGAAAYPRIRRPGPVVRCGARRGPSHDRLHDAHAGACGHDAFHFQLVEKHLAGAWGSLGDLSAAVPRARGVRQRRRPAVQHDGARPARVVVRERRQPAPRRGHARDVGADLAGHPGRRCTRQGAHQRCARADLGVERDGAALLAASRRGLDRTTR